MKEVRELRVATGTRSGDSRFHSPLSPLSSFALVFLLGCVDIPLLPHWTADWSVPLQTQDIALYGPFGWSVAAGTTASISFPPQRQALTETIGSLLNQKLSDASVVVTIRKDMPVSAIDTVFVAPDSASLTNPAAQRIVIPVTVSATERSLVDTVALPGNGLAMLQAQARMKGAIWVQLRGQVLFAGPGTLTVTTADSVYVRLTLLATIAVSR